MAALRQCQWQPNISTQNSLLCSPLDIIWEKHHGQLNLKFKIYLAIFIYLYMAISSLIPRLARNISDWPETAPSASQRPAQALGHFVYDVTVQAVCVTSARLFPSLHTKHITQRSRHRTVVEKSVPRGKLSVWVIKTSQLMLYREIMAVCSEIHTKHINTLCGQNVELLNVKLAVYIVTTGL